MFEESGREVPVYRQIYERIRGRVLSGRLAAGDRMPSSRSLAEDLGVSRTTVLSAYNQLIAEGYLLTRERGGTFVSESVPDWNVRAVPRPGTAAGDGPGGWPGTISTRAEALLELPLPPPREGERRYRIDFRHAEPERPDFPTRVWSSLVREWSRRASHRRVPPEGVEDLRRSISRYLDRMRGVDCEPGQVVVTAGFQHALYVVARVLAEEGDEAVIEEPHYQGVRQAVVAAGLRPLPVAADREGLKTAELPNARRGIPLAIVSPSHQFPLGGVLPLSRRLALLAWASRAGATIVEDDYDSEYRYEGRPLATLRSLDAENRVLYLGTFSKTLSPWVRLGFIVAAPELVDALRRAVWATHRFANPAVQHALAGLLDDGHFERNLRRVRRRNAERRDRLLEAADAHLGDRIDLWGAETGGHAVGWLPGIDREGMEALVTSAARADVGLSSLRDHYLRPPEREGLVLKYAGISPDGIEEGIRRIAECLDAIA